MIVLLARAQLTSLRSVSTGSTAPGRVGRGIQPQQADVAGRGQRAVRAQQLCAGQPGAHLVRRIRQLGDRHRVGAGQPQLERQAGDRLLGADGRDHRLRVQPADLVRAVQPPRVRPAQRQGALRRRVAGEVAAVGERGAHRPRHPVHRRADGQVDQPAGVGGGPFLQIPQLVPGSTAGSRDCQSTPTAQCSAIGGSAATNGSSRWILPTRDAPPGEPSSSKKSTLAR